MLNLNLIDSLRNKLCTFEKNRQNREFFTNVGALLSSLFCLQMQVLHVILKILTSKDFLYVNQDIVCQTWRFQCIEGHTSAVKWFQKHKNQHFGNRFIRRKRRLRGFREHLRFWVPSIYFSIFYGSWVNKSMVH